MMSFLKGDVGSLNPLNREWLTEVRATHHSTGLLRLSGDLASLQYDVHIVGSVHCL